MNGLMQRCRECGREFPYVDAWRIFCPACDRLALGSQRHTPIDESKRCDHTLGQEHQFTLWTGSQFVCQHCRRSEEEVRHRSTNLFAFAVTNARMEFGS
jgi:uncharacterized Zn ribbon protein